jgi:adenylate cyclase
MTVQGDQGSEEVSDAVASDVPLDTVAEPKPSKPRAARKMAATKKRPSVSRPTGDQSTAPEVTAEAFIEHILGAPLEFTSDEVAELAGVSEETTRILWRAMGFADVGGSRAFTTHDVEALRSLTAQIDEGRLTLSDAVEVARAIGQSTARLAEWQGNTISRTLQDRGIIKDISELQPEEVVPVMRESELMKPVMENLLIYSWRRQMAASAARGAAVAQAGPGAKTDAMSVGFADLVGFTRLSRQIAEIDLAHLVQTFESVSADIVAGTGARLVKTLGDEVLFIDKSPDVIAETALRLHEAHRTSQAFPKMRIG